MAEKTIDGWLVVDWKQGTTRTHQTKPGASEIGTNELLAELRVDVTVPDIEVPTLAVEIDVPEPQVYSATLDALDDEDLPDWSNVAAEVVADREAEIASSSADGLPYLIDQMTARVLLNVNTRPAPETVREHVSRLVENLLRIKL